MTNDDRSNEPSGPGGAKDADRRSPPDGRWTTTTRHHKWVVLSNTTLGILMAAVNASIVLISLPAIFRGIGLNPLAPANVSYLLWMLMGYPSSPPCWWCPSAASGDMVAACGSYNLGFWCSPSPRSRCRFDPFHLGGGAVWLIGWRVVRASAGRC